MAISKDKKKTLIQEYVDDLNGAKHIILVKQNGVKVNSSVKIRKEIKNVEGKMNIIRKRLFLLALKQAGLEEIDIKKMDGSVFALYAKGEEYGPLKVVNKYLKEFKKEDKKSAFSFLGGRIEKMRKDGEYINELANIPTKEELLSKFVYLLNYPVQSFACVLDQIAKKTDTKAEPVVVNAEKVVEQVEQKIEEVTTPTQEVSANTETQ
ncbi:MAG: 50S ribosomal protein L10 [Candidatus Absconditabacterales bacterium]